jgi:hypothetical protein
MKVSNERPGVSHLSSDSDNEAKQKQMESKGEIQERTNCFLSLT